MRTEGCRVISPASMEYFNALEQDLAAAMSKVGAQIASALSGGFDTIFGDSSRRRITEDGTKQKADS